jgi:hypothetical protein
MINAKALGRLKLENGRTWGRPDNYLQASVYGFRPHWEAWGQAFENHGGQQRARYDHSAQQQRLDCIMIAERGHRVDWNFPMIFVSSAFREAVL